MRFLKSLILILLIAWLGCVTQPQKSGSDQDWDTQAEVMKQYQAERQACEIEGKQK